MLCSRSIPAGPSERTASVGVPSLFASFLFDNERSETGVRVRNAGGALVWCQGLSRGAAAVNNPEGFRTSTRISHRGA